ncbi:hypothetical protein BSK54_23830 [Paenibacillus odorifer]|jgi:hypothetical protein|nr:hypothetical protein BSK55_14240 [Paenibacillus odorifer]OMD97649.1 hypothetical protein BSK54_23830 [Paenibacillus odorifer]
MLFCNMRIQLLIFRTQMPLFVNLSLFREIIGPERRYWAEMVLSSVYFVLITPMESYSNSKIGKYCK